MIRTLTALLVGLLLCATLSAGLAGCSEDPEAEGYEVREAPAEGEKRAPPGPQSGPQAESGEGQEAPPPPGDE
jgi:hypothetical protein